MENCELKELSGAVPTPSYVFDTDAFGERVALVKEAFGEKVGICFSIKANPFLLPYLPESFKAIEVCSPGELTICEKLGVDMDKIIFSGVNKTEEDVERAMADGVGVFTAESLLHLEHINRSAVKRGKTVPVLLRLTAGSQFGMDEKDVLYIIDHRSDYPGVEIVGLHYFSGTQKRKPTAIEKELNYVMDFVAKVEKEHDFKLQRLEYGTGLAVDYFAEDPLTPEMDRLNAVSVKLREIAETIELTVEMGRFFAAPCGHYFTKVTDVKTNAGVNYAIVDGGIHQLHYDGQIQGMQVPRIFHVKAGQPAGDVDKWTLCGSLCTTGDVLTRDVEFNTLTPGDILVFQWTGAYSAMEGMAVFLSRDMPQIFIYSKETGLVKARGRINTDSINMPDEYRRSIL